MCAYVLAHGHRSQAGWETQAPTTGLHAPHCYPSRGGCARDCGGREREAPGISGERPPGSEWVHMPGASPSSLLHCCSMARANAGKAPACGPACTAPCTLAWPVPTVGAIRPWNYMPSAAALRCRGSSSRRRAGLQEARHAAALAPQFKLRQHWALPLLLVLLLLMLPRQSGAVPSPQHARRSFPPHPRSGDPMKPSGMSAGGVQCR